MYGSWRKLILDLAVLGVVAVIAVAAVSLLAPNPGEDGPPRVSLRPTTTPAAEPTESAEAAAVLIGAGDIADCERHQDGLTADALERIDGTVFTLGDHAYPDASRANFEECYGPTWGRPSIKERTRPTVGDDDYEGQGAAAYFEYFGDAAGDPATGYYAYDAGAWRVYVINSQCRAIGGCGAGTGQETWLRADLEANPRDCVLAMWHEPYFTSGSNGSDSMRQMWRVLYDAGAELILSANHHAYERFAPQTPAGLPDAERGIVQFVVGTAGGSPEDFDAPIPNSLVQASRVYGVLRLELSPGSYAFEFVDVAGADFNDDGTGECH